MIQNDTLARISAQLATQDNAGTVQPCFVVYDKRRIYGVDPAYHDCEYVYTDEYGDTIDIYTTPHDLEQSIEDGVVTRIGFIRVDQFRAAFFTRQAALDYIERNKHNLSMPFVFVESAHANPEWQAVRAALMLP